MVSVSVIIPVYNTQNFLRRCLDSVCNQTLKDIEIICVNDCSPDNSLEILKEYAKNDNRIKLIDFAENKGVSVARNTGIDKAQGDYIGFVDSDDFIDLDFYEKLYNKAVETNADAVKGNYKDFKTGSVDFYLNQKVRENKTNFSFAFCSGIYKKEVVDRYGIRFPILKDMEDPVFTFNFALKANKVEVVDDANVTVCRREGSATFGVPSLSQIEDKFTGLEMLINLANDDKLQSKSYCFVLALWFYNTFATSSKNKSVEAINFMANKFYELKKHVKNSGAFYAALNPVFSESLKNESLVFLANNTTALEKQKIFAKLRENLQKSEHENAKS